MKKNYVSPHMQVLVLEDAFLPLLAGSEGKDGGDYITGSGKSRSYDWEEDY